MWLNKKRKQHTWVKTRYDSQSHTDLFIITGERVFFPKTARCSMKIIYTAADPATAHIVRGILASYGIDSEVRGEALFSVRGELPMVGDTFPTVWIVKDVDHLKAQEIVEDFDSRLSGKDNNGASWTCGNCGEQLESQFTACWQCETPRPDILPESSGKTV
jgi:hypothetical protein